MISKDWADFQSRKSLSVVGPRFLKSDTKVFAMGSCFAAEIYAALKGRGYNVYPRYTDVKILDGQIFDKVAQGREFIAHYDIFVMHQEIRSALGIWDQDSRREGYYTVENAPVNKMLSSPVVWQDPHRKLCYSSSLKGLDDLAARITRIIKEGLDSADCFIFTLGLIENWKSRKTGMFFCRPPETGYGGGANQADFHLAEYTEILKELTEMIKLLREHYPSKQIVVSVSPVPLERTFLEKTDVYTANLESKATLRAVVARFIRDNSNVIYFPAYEMANMYPVADVFEDDRRHVRRQFADHVVSNFISCFSVE